MPHTCPYCCFALADAGTRCASCGAAHHVDCWSENGGCSVVGCASAPASAAVVPASFAAGQSTAPDTSFVFTGVAAGHSPGSVASPVLPPPPGTHAPPAWAGGNAAPAAWPPVQPPTTTSPLPGRARPGSRALIIAVVVLILSVAGSAIALVATGALGPSEEQRRLDAYRAQALQAMQDFDALDNELDDGLKFVEYEILVDRAGETFSDLESSTPLEFQSDEGFVAMSRAIEEYRDARTAWGDYLDCTYCDYEIDETLQSYWGDASGALDRARKALKDSR